MRHSFLNRLLGGVAGGVALATLAAQPIAKAATGPDARAQVQNLLRRFAFSAAPEQVNAVLAEGTGTWLSQQLNWQAIDDSKSQLEQPPTQLNGDYSYPDYTVYERILMQHMVLTQRQVQAKMELHWLDHFSISLGTVFDPAIMAHYDATVRADALGNFAKLLADVAKEPAMLYWLNNNVNMGGTPNENFGREIMQLYTTGIDRLNMDGSVKLAGNGLPLPNYTQADVQALAEAMTGYVVNIDYSNMDPQTRFSVQYVPANHYTGPLSFLGRSRNVPNSGKAIDFVANVLATQPSTAPFMAKELLQRFVTETPSPKYIEAIAKVWAQTQAAPDQIAQVITAIINNPEFVQASYHAMPKQPTELLIGLLHQLPGVLQQTSTTPPASMLLWEGSYIGQQLFYPPNVFGFYRPGDVESEINTSTMLYRSSVTTNMVNGAAGQAGMDTYIDIPTLRARIGATEVKSIATYLLDATLDGGTPAQFKALVAFMGPNPSDNQIRGAMWLLLNTPDYAVN